MHILCYSFNHALLNVFVFSSAHARLLLSLLAANEIHGAEFGIDIRDLIKLDDVTSRLHLGPNGGLVYVVPRHVFTCSACHSL